MGFWQRLKLIGSSNANAALDKAENPEKILDQLIRDMRKQMQEAKRQVVLAVADEKRLGAQLEAEKQRLTEWERKAMLAVRSGRDDLARQALERKNEHMKLATDLQGAWEQQHAATDKLRSQLRDLNDKIEEAGRKKNVLIARHKRAKAQQKIQETMSGLSDTSAFDTFDRMADKVADVEARAAASEEIAGDFSGDNLDNEFAALEAGAGTDADLEALKVRMGVPGDLALPAAGESTGAEPADVEAELAALKENA